MRSRDRMLAAMETGIQGNFPIVIPYEGIFLRDHWEEVTNRPWWAFHDPNLSTWLEVEGDLLEKVEMDWISCGLCPSKGWREGHRIEGEGSRVFLVGSDGVREEVRREPRGGSHIPVEKEPVIESMGDVDRCIRPLDGNDLLRDGHLDFAKAVVDRFGSEKFGPRQLLWIQGDDAESS
jgi:hypothetical protein